MYKRGFTLIEMVFVIIILSVVAAIGSRVMGASFNAYFTNQNVINADAQGRLALEKLVRDIHNIASPSGITTATPTSLSFLDLDGVTVTYTISGTQLLRNGITLADGINNLAFSYYNGAGAVTATTSAIRYVNVSLNVTKNNVNYALMTTITTLNYV